MRLYEEPIDVRRGLVSGAEAPEQFLWRGRLWVVRETIAHWIETGAWWQQAGVAELLGVGSGSGGGGSGGRPGSGSDDGADAEPGEAPAGASALDRVASLGADLLGEREVWRVDAARGRENEGSEGGSGVFDIAFDWGGAGWQLVRSVD